MARRVAVVTGGNKGIGLGIVRGLCQKFDGDVILAARDEARGQAAVSGLQKENLQPKFHQVDVTDTASIARLRDFLKEHYQGLDLLVNNAGVLLEDLGSISSGKLISNEALPSCVEETMAVNYTGQVNVSESLFPLLRPHARVCNVSSMMATTSYKQLSPELQAKFTAPDITTGQLTDLMDQFVRTAKAGTHMENGFANSAYGMSKVGLCVLTIIQQRELDKQGAQDVVVNSCSPGYVQTDMTRGKGNRTVEEGAITPLYCSLLPPDITSPRGQMLRDEKIMDWTVGPTPDS